MQVGTIYAFNPKKSSKEQDNEKEAFMRQKKKGNLINAVPPHRGSNTRRSFAARSTATDVTPSRNTLQPAQAWVADHGRDVSEGGLDRTAQAASGRGVHLHW